MAFLTPCWAAGCVGTTRLAQSQLLTSDRCRWTKQHGVLRTQLHYRETVIRGSNSLSAEKILFLTADVLLISHSLQVSSVCFEVDPWKVSTDLICKCDCSVTKVIHISEMLNYASNVGWAITSLTAKGWRD